MPHLSRFAAIAALLVFTVSASAQERPTDELRPPDLQAAHGALLDGNLRAVEATPELIEEFQARLLETVRKDASREALQREERIRAQLDEIDADAFHRAFTMSGIISMLADTNERLKEDRELAGQVTSLNAMLRGQIRKAYRRPLEWKKEAVVSFDEKVVAVWKDARIIDWIIVALGNSYIRDCRAKGVPVPTYYGGAGWAKSTLDEDGPGPQLVGELGNEFIIEGSTTIVWGWSSQSPRGTCIGLPRGGATTAGTAGVICQSNETANACFFDNLNDDGSSFTVTEGEQIPMTQFATGPELVAMGAPTGTCPACHRGENAFIIHPGSALDLTAQGYNLRSGTGWYKPLFGPNAGTAWENPPPTTAFDNVTLGTSSQSISLLFFTLNLTVNDRGCNGCHQLPQENGSFCNFLEQAAEGTMPPKPEPPANWSRIETRHDFTFAKHINALRAACGFGPAPVNAGLDWFYGPGE